MSTSDPYTTLMSISTLMHWPQEKQMCIFDCRTNPADSSAGQRDYDEGHIPRARFADLDRDLAGPVTAHSGRHPLPDRKLFCEWLRSQGVSDEAQVVAYDAKGGIFAARLWWMLRWVGHQQVAVLDGGLDNWVKAGGALETNIAPKVTQGTIKCKPALSEPVSTEHVMLIVSERKEVRLIDARAPQRYQGLEEPLDPVAGHIPGAVNYHCFENLNLDGRFLSREALQQKLSRIVGRGNEEVISYCGSGVTACHNLLVLEHIGIHGARLYPGSWSEWIRDPRRPTKTGVSP